MHQYLRVPWIDFLVACWEEDNDSLKEALWLGGVAGVPGRGAERTASLIYLVLVGINLEPCTLTLRGQAMHHSGINPTLEGLKAGMGPAS
ncbi:unnamed protein product [Boreogadus saida]